VDDTADLGQITAPTLLLWGERDEFFFQEEVEELAAAIPGARLLVYPDTGHAVQWERPAQVANDLDTFVREG
jgi:non-heme chloroperoxidase